MFLGIAFCPGRRRSYHSHRQGDASSAVRRLKFRRGKTSGQLQFCLSLSAPLQTQSISDGERRRRIENDNVVSILDASYCAVEPFEEQPEIVTVFCARQEGMSNSRSMSSRLPGTRSTSGNTSSGSHPPANVARYRTGLRHRPFHSLRDRIPAGCCTRPSSTLSLRVQVDAKDAIALEAEKMGQVDGSRRLGVATLKFAVAIVCSFSPARRQGSRVWASSGRSAARNARSSLTRLTVYMRGLLSARSGTGPFPLYGELPQSAFRKLQQAYEVGC